MKIEDQLVSKEVAKEMKELGFKHKSLFQWVPESLESDKYYVCNSDCLNGVTYSYKAYSVAELGEMLPKKIEKNRVTFHLDIYNMRESTRLWQLAYTNNKGISLDYISKEVKEANCRAKMLIYLKKNNLIQ